MTCKHEIRHTVRSLVNTPPNQVSRGRGYLVRMEPTEDLEAEAKGCRLCWGDEDDGPLVQPCACRGSAKWIHKHCLEEWRRTSPKQDAAYRCGQCMDHYRDALSLELLSERLQTERTSSTLSTLGSELLIQGTHDEAELLVREVLEVDRETLGKRHPSSIHNLGMILYVKGDFAAAEPLLREALEVTREALSDRHPSTLTNMSNLGLLLKEKGDLAAAEPLLREVEEVWREVLGNRHLDTLTSICNLGHMLHAKGDLAAAEPLLREALEVTRQTLGNRHPLKLSTMNRLGALLQTKGDFGAAEPLLREALEVQRETLGDRHRHTLATVGNLGLLLYAKTDLAAAEPLYREAREGLRETLGSQHPLTLRAVNNLDLLLQAKGDAVAAYLEIWTPGCQKTVISREMLIARGCLVPLPLRCAPPPPPSLAVGETAELDEAANSQALYPAGSSAEQARGTRRRWLSVKAVREAKAALYPAGSSAEQARVNSIKALHEAAAAHEAEMAEQLADHWAEQAGFRVLSI